MYSKAINPTDCTKDPALLDAAAAAAGDQPKTARAILTYAYYWCVWGGSLVVVHWCLLYILYAAYGGTAS